MSSTDTRLGDDDLFTGQTNSPVKLQELYIPVHGYVRLRPEEMAIIDHPTFQRLRKCRQLGFAHLVFPGAVHSRFEHSIGALYVANKIIQYVNYNTETSPLNLNHAPRFAYCRIDENTERFIRLGALLHDIGHIPLGHTLEDELCHLEKHDGEARIADIAERHYKEYTLNPGLQLELEVPEEGWSLRSLVDALYQIPVDELMAGQRTTNITAFDILKQITLKAPKSDGKSADLWKKNETELNRVIPVNVCRDIIGNTICADFLDYIFRDWHHIGKPMAEDRRLYQYMELRAPEGETENPASQEFVINVGPNNKLRHDAITNIFELLESRYKLAETVLFHRTKLAMIALLDRCFLELRALYRGAGVKGKHERSEHNLAHQALLLLLECGDDDVPNVIRQLTRGVSKADQAALAAAQKRHDEFVQSAVSPQKDQPQFDIVGENGGEPYDVKKRQNLIDKLATRLEERVMYTLACNLPRREIRSTDIKRTKPEAVPEKLQALIDPDTRYKQIIMLEELIGLPEGSLTLYAPPSAKMNAKIARVKLLINGQIKTFVDYENDMGDDSQTGGVLKAQMKRFWELWGVSIFVDRPNWHRFSKTERADVAEVMTNTLYIPSTEEGREAARRVDCESKIIRIRKVAARQSPEGKASESDYQNDTFVSGMPFSAPDDD